MSRITTKTTLRPHRPIPNEQLFFATRTLMDLQCDYTDVLDSNISRSSVLVDTL